MYKKIIVSDPFYFLHKKNRYIIKHGYVNLKLIPIFRFRNIVNYSFLQRKKDVFCYRLHQQKRKSNRKKGKCTTLFYRRLTYFMF